MHRNLSGTLRVLAVSFCLTSCNSGVSPDTNPSATLTLTAQSAYVFAGQSMKLTVTDTRGSSDVIWSVEGTEGENGPYGTVDPSGVYSAGNAEKELVVKVVVASRSDSTKRASVTITVLPTGTVTPTSNPLVAEYSLVPPPGSNVYIRFGRDTSYQFRTWTQPVTSMYVAGMRPAMQYHMQAVVLAPDGSVFADGDHLFTTAALPTGYQPNFSIETPSGLTPQPGIELMNTLQGGLQAFATDLSGTVVWYYPEASFSVQPIKLLPNGHLAVLISPGTPTPVGTPEPAGAIDTIREIDLVGNTIRELSLSDLNNKLAAGGYNFTAFAYHHEITALPNGHWLTFVAIQKQFTDLPGYPGTITVQGDVVIDLDQSFNPVWVWNEFDHLDVNRHPFQFPDWTHSNAIIYSKDDGNILVSLRHQNWLIKVDYNNGQGTGDIIWKLGYEGDFTLLGGTDPTDWFYAQHGPSFFSASTTRNFILGLFDNGDDRVFPANVSCGAPGAPPCNYSTVPILQIDESAKTATIVSNYTAPLYSFFGGNTDQLPNTDVHFCESGTATGAAITADIFEVTQSSTPQIVWHLHSPTAYIYRSYRLGSLYPGVQW